MSVNIHFHCKVTFPAIQLLRSELKMTLLFKNERADVHATLTLSLGFMHNNLGPGHSFEPGC